MFAFWLVSICWLFDATAAGETGPERRAIAYLSREVPRWSRENQCFSCHNNGDAARALYVAVRQSLPVPAESLADTTRWLADPDRWDKNKGYEAASDKVLARIQFAAALVEAMDAGKLADRKALARAAELVAEHQSKDGSWKVDAKGSIGSPTTYGACLATYLARRALHRADRQRYREGIARADRWFRTARVTSVPDTAAILLALETHDDEAARRQRRACLELLRNPQDRDGGWGPHVNSQPEPFDTAVAILALVQFKDQAEYKLLVSRGRRYLLSTQQRDGSWRETTRPAGAESYAQRLSTTGWATLALLATRP